MKFFAIVCVLLFTNVNLAEAGIADSIAQGVFNQKIEEVYQAALKCSPLEKDPKSKMTVIEWLKIRPALPSWKMLMEIEQTANEARNYARSIGGKDKYLHCLAGCFIAQKLDYTSGVLVGWYKELQDASDCSKSTSFEKLDYEATVFGAKIKNSDSNCKKYCKAEVYKL